MKYALIFTLCWMPVSHAEYSEATNTLLESAGVYAGAYSGSEGDSSSSNGSSSSSSQSPQKKPTKIPTPKAAARAGRGNFSNAIVGGGAKGGGGGKGGGGLDKSGKSSGGGGRAPAQKFDRWFPVCILATPGSSGIQALASGLAKIASECEVALDLRVIPAQGGGGDPASFLQAAKGTCNMTEAGTAYSNLGVNRGAIIAPTDYAFARAMCGNTEMGVSDAPACSEFGFDPGQSALSRAQSAGRASGVAQGPAVTALSPLAMDPAIAASYVFGINMMGLPQGDSGGYGVGTKEQGFVTDPLNPTETKWSPDACQRMQQAAFPQGKDAGGRYFAVYRPDAKYFDESSFQKKLITISEDTRLYGKSGGGGGTTDGALASKSKHGSSGSAPSTSGGGGGKGIATASGAHDKSGALLANAGVGGATSAAGGSSSASGANGSATGNPAPTTRAGSVSTQSKSFFGSSGNQTLAEASKTPVTPGIENSAEAAAKAAANAGIGTSTPGSPEAENPTEATPTNSSNTGKQEIRRLPTSTNPLDDSFFAEIDKKKKKEEGTRAPGEHPTAL